MKMMDTRFANDSVIRYNPITFAAAFVREMRKQKAIANIPSVRTTISIPRFLTARYFRKEALDPMDYFEAAVFNTPFEDQKIAERVASTLLFPEKKRQEKREKKKKVDAHPDMNISGLDAVLAELNEAGFEDIKDIMEEAGSNIIDEMIEEQENAWDFLDELNQSQDQKDEARMQMLSSLESEYAVIQHGLTNRQFLDAFLSDQLAQKAGSWKPDVFEPAHILGMGEQLNRQAQLPWESATAAAVTVNNAYKQIMQDMLDNSLPISLGTTLNYLNTVNHPPDQDWVEEAFKRIQSMNDYHEMIRGMKQFRPPPKEVLDRGSANDVRNALDVAESIDNIYGSDLSPTVFNKFMQSNKSPNVQQVQDATYDSGGKDWEKMLEQAAHQDAKKMNSSQLKDLAMKINSHSSNRMSTEMKKAQTQIAKEISTQVMESIGDREQFIATLDFLLQEVQPKFKRTVSAGKKLGISETEITEMFKQPLQILKNHVEQNSNDSQKYDQVVRKISRIPPQDMNEMMNQAIENDNSISMGALGAVDLGGALKAAQGRKMADGSSAEEKVADSLDKSIGGGTNLLQQWFMHRRNIPLSIRNRLRNMMKEALLEIGMEWANKGTGSSEEGIIPTTNTRPYRPGDELDSLDIEATLDAILMSGKKLEQITEEQLMVNETSKGKTSLGVLIDISGSMSGKHLAMCAIAVVMLLGKLESKEVAIALFESNTHRIKGFLEEKELDDVADELLDLQARGGTRADAALRWINNEFESVTDSEVKVLYFLSDFYLSENTQQLTHLLEPMAADNVKILAAYHGNYSRGVMQHMVDILDGTSMKIEKFNNLPAIISDAIASISS